MKLKRLYNKEAPKKDWIKTDDDRLIPPVSGVRILHAGPKQNFSPNLVYIAQKEGWMSISGNELIITGENRTLVYDILRVPGKYDDGTINYYECVLKRDGK